MLSYSFMLLIERELMNNISDQDINNDNDQWHGNRQSHNLCLRSIHSFIPKHIDFVPIDEVIDNQGDAQT